MTNISLLKKIDFAPSAEELELLKRETKAFIALVEESLRNQKIDGDVFIGGSYAKGTLTRETEYDVDISIRLNWKYEDLSAVIEPVVSAVSSRFGVPYSRVHGSRDYFRVSIGQKLNFEVIPVLRIRHPREARNVTDLSYFHVSYVKKKLTRASARDIQLAKKFCKAQGVYGAEGYVNGFSGYGLECLIITYGGFVKMLKALVKVKKGERIILDPARHYGKKQDVLFELNEAKIKGPIVLVDPTWKERNVLAALKQETFEKFQRASKELLKRPSLTHFEDQEVNVDKLKSLAKKNKGEFIHIRLSTNRQEGDIAGTKMQKFTRFLLKNINPRYKVLSWAYRYEGRQESEAFMAVKSKGNIVHIGPNLEMKDHVKHFKARHKNTFVKNGMVHAKEKITDSADSFIMKFTRNYKTRLDEMGISKIKVLRK